MGLSREWHPFSIASSPDNEKLLLAVKGLGDFTKDLGNLKPGAEAEIEGAYGKFSYTNYKNKNQIWVGGGIGITPFLSMARSLPDEGYKIDLYYSVRTASEVIDWPMLYNTAISKNGQFRVIPYIGDQQPGHLTADYIESISGSVNDKEIYICGPAPMMTSLRKQFRDKSVPGTSIHTEEFAMS
jgi:predicted ferric reductase